MLRLMLSIRFWVAARNRVIVKKAEMKSFFDCDNAGMMRARIITTSNMLFGGSCD